MDPEETIIQNDEAPAIDTSDSPAPGPQLGAPEQYPPQAPVPGGASDEQSAIPVEDDASGVNQAVEGNQSGEGIRNALSAPRRAVGNAASSIMALLTGAGADHPATLDQAGKQVDPDGKLSPSDRNMRAVSHVAETEGQDAALRLLQTNRVAYNAKTAFAEQALKGNAQRPADLNASLHAANEAQSHVLDGSNVVFSQHRGMITATVTSPGSKDQQHINLTVAQYAAFLDQSTDGQWDKVMDASAPATLQRLAASGPAAQAQPEVAQGRGATRLDQVPAQPQAQQAAPQEPQPQEPQSGEEAPQTPTPQRRPAPRPQRQPVEYSQDAFDRGGASGRGAGNQPAIPGTHDENGHYIGPNNGAQEGDYSPALEARSRRLFPSVGEEHQRQAWMAAQEQQETKNEIDAKRAGHDWTVESARLRADAAKSAAMIKADAQAKTDQSKLLQQAQKMMQNQQDARMREAGRNMRAEISSPNFLVQTEDQRRAIAKKWGVDPATVGEQPEPQQQQAAPQPQQQQAPQQQQSSQSLPPREQRVAGQTKVTTSKGTFVWGADNQWHTAGQ